MITLPLFANRVALAFNSTTARFVFVAEMKTKDLAHSVFNPPEAIAAEIFMPTEAALQLRDMLVRQFGTGQEPRQ